MSQEGVKQPRVGVGVFVMRDGKFLMGRRKGSHGEGTWSLPGGHLEYGETPEETAVREVREEVALELANVCFVAMTNDVFEEEDKHYVTIWVTSDLKSGEPTIMEPDKCDDLGWFDLGTMQEPLFLPWRQLLRSEFMPELQSRLEASKLKDA